MQKYKLVEGFIGKMAVVKVVSASVTVVDVLFKSAVNYEKELDFIVRKYKIGKTWN